MSFLLGYAQKSKFKVLDEKVSYIFWLFILLIFSCLSFFFFSHLFAAVIGLLLEVLPVEKASLSWANFTME